VRVGIAIAIVALLALGAFALGRSTAENGDAADAGPVGATNTTVTASIPPTSAAPGTTAPTITLGSGSGEDDDADALATDIELPSDCPLPLDDPASLPNSPRTYRAGTHRGVDFICGETGRTARAALDGRVVLAFDDQAEPDPEGRQALLDIAGARGSTPPFTLTMLYGNVVVLDHGLVDGVGHVVTVYAHLDSVTEGLVTGQAVSAGDAVGIIGNSGTSTAAEDGDRPRSLHLHWELLIDDEPLAAGADEQATRAAYATLFGS